MLAAAGALAVVEAEGGGEGSEHAAVGRGHGDGGVGGRAEQGAEHADVGVDADRGVDDPLPCGDASHRIALGESGEGDVHEPAARAVEPRVVEPEGGRGARAHVLQHHVGFGRPFPARPARRLVLEVQLDEALPAVQEGVDGVGRAAGPHDLDDVRPLVGEQHGGHPTGPASAEIEHAHRSERRGPFLSRICHLHPPEADPAGVRGSRGRSAATGAGQIVSVARRGPGRGRSGRGGRSAPRGGAGGRGSRVRERGPARHRPVQPARGKVTPTRVSRVTSFASASSLIPSVPGGRMGSTM